MNSSVVYWIFGVLRKNHRRLSNYWHFTGDFRDSLIATQANCDFCLHVNLTRRFSDSLRYSFTWRDRYSHPGRLIATVYQYSKCGHLSDAQSSENRSNCSCLCEPSLWVIHKACVSTACSLTDVDERLTFIFKRCGLRRFSLFDFLFSSCEMSNSTYICTWISPSLRCSNTYKNKDVSGRRITAIRDMCYISNISLKVFGTR